MIFKNTFVALATLIFIGCQSPKEIPSTASSPDGKVELNFQLNEEGIPHYSVIFQGQPVIEPSSMGFELKDAPSLRKSFEIIDGTTKSIDETWEMPWGEQAEVRNHCNELSIQLKESTEPYRLMNIVFRVFDDGVGFRYEFPEQQGLEELIITDENTEFQLTGDHTVWWQPGDWDIYEHLYNQSKFSEIDALSKRDNPNLIATYIPENAVNTPVTMKTGDGLYLSFHEADLTNYAGMTLKVAPDQNRMSSELVGSELLGAKAKVSVPFETPWRTITIGEKAGDLIDSKMSLNLNDPNILGDISYFTPMKYVGIWWEMHIGKSTWDLEGSQDMSTYTEGEKGSSTHGATTENALRYIDFAAENGIQGLLVEGWNTGWDQWINSTDREGIFDFITPYPDYDFDRVMDYAKEKGIEVIMHHETSAAPRTYEKQMQEAYTFMKENGMHSVKTGYVGKIIPEGEYHHGQWMVNHYQKVLETAAQYKVAVNAHEPIKATGKRRTYPNAIAREGLRGQEFNAWAKDGGNPPDHLPTIAFTRMLAGPIDFTPGAFNIKFDEYKENNQVNTTIAQQLALYVVITSPIQMACDLPEHYMNDGIVHPGFQFITDVGVDWKQSLVLDGEVGDYVVMAREEKNTGNWFVGGITDENPRTFSVNFDFLSEGENYSAKIYKDGEDAHWDSNPEALSIESMEVNKDTVLEIDMAPGGGFAISLLKT